MQNIIKDILIAQMSFPLKYKNEKEIWWENKWGEPITIEVADIENEYYIVRQYWSNDQLYYKENYHQGHRHGERLEWHNDGQLCVKENYHQGQLHGERLRWHENGKLWIEKNYHQGQPHGEWLWRYSDGRPSYKEKYNHGKLINAEHY